MIHRDYAEDMVAFMSDTLERDIELKEIKGSSRLLKMLVDGNWDNDEVIRIKSGRKRYLILLETGSKIIRYW